MPVALEVSAPMIALSARHQVMTVVYVVRRWLLRTKPVRRFLRRGIRRAFRSHPAVSLLPPPLGVLTVWQCELKDPLAVRKRIVDFLD